MSSKCTAARVAAIAIGLFTSIPQAAQAGTSQIDPAGLYFHRFAGTFNGTEWSTFGELAAPGRYEFSDLTNEGTFPLTYASDNTFVLDRSQGTGSMSDENTGSIDFTISGGFNFHSQLTRAPYTDTRFPVFNTGAVDGDASLTGIWEGIVREVDPLTGATLSESTQRVELDSSGTIVRLTLEDNSFHQAVWLSDDQAGFRVINGGFLDARYETWVGSDTSVDQNLVGDLRLLEDGRLTAALFFQTRAPIGRQDQTMTYLELGRIPAPATGLPLALAGMLASRRRR